MRIQIFKILSLAALLFLSTSLFATNKALLIGISHYQYRADKLEGPENDVDALAENLLQYWGFEIRHVEILKNENATRANILKALTKLKDNTQASDQIFIYFSGHGTSTHDKNSGLALPYSDSGALVPYGYRQGITDKQQIINNLIVGKRDLRPIFTEMDKSNAQIFIAFDSCYSGSANRGLFNSLPSRSLSTNVFDINSFDDEETQGYFQGTQTIEPYPYNNIVYFSAASPREKALDIPARKLSLYPTIDKKPHGAFTDALLRALSGKLNTDTNKDGQTNYNELLTAVKDFMKTRGYSHEPYISPSLTEDYRSLSLRNVMGRQGTFSIVPAVKPDLPGVYITPTDLELAKAFRLLPQLQVKKQRTDLNLEKKENNYLLRNKAGDLITTIDSKGIEEIVGRVQQEVWKMHFKQQLQQRASINIEMSVKEGLTGSTIAIGDKLAFSFRSEKPIYLLLLNADSKGTLSVLYPFRTHELNRLPAHQVKYIPSENKNDWIEVQAPIGTDHLIAIGFTEEPGFLREFIGKEVVLLQSDFYKNLMKHLKSVDYGYSELDLLTVLKN